jgi:hypothetical protein
MLTVMFLGIHASLTSLDATCISCASPYHIPQGYNVRVVCESNVTRFKKQCGDTYDLYSFVSTLVSLPILNVDDTDVFTGMACRGDIMMLC